jgi:hypothetical protein
MVRPKNPYGYFEYVGRRITLTQTYSRLISRAPSKKSFSTFHELGKLGYRQKGRIGMGRKAVQFIFFGASALCNVPAQAEYTYHRFINYIL